MSAMKMLILGLAIILSSLQQESGRVEQTGLGPDETVNQEAVQRKE